VTGERSLISDEMRASVGTTSAPRSFVVERLVAGRLAESLGENPAAVTSAAHAPVYYVSAFETQMAELALPIGLGQGVLAGDDWELRRPLCWDERLVGVGRIAEIYERFGGQHGQTLYIRHQWEFKDEADELVAVGTRIFVRYFAAAETEEAP
jgi:hypothetical protein